MANLYVVSTFMSEEMASYSHELFSALTKRGIVCLKPSFSGKVEESKKQAEELFLHLCLDITKAETILFIAENETADWGAVLGFAYGLKKEIIILAEEDTYISFMASRMKTKSLRVKSIKEIEAYADNLTELIKKD